MSTLKEKLKVLDEEHQVVEKELTEKKQTLQPLEGKLQVMVSRG